MSVSLVRLGQRSTFGCALPALIRALGTNGFCGSDFSRDASVLSNRKQEQRD
jgi:hypothetical protein